MSVHKQPKVFNTTYTIQSHANCPIFFYMFLKSCVGFTLSNCSNAKKKFIWNSIYTIYLSIECSQATKSIQYNIHDTKSCELPNSFYMFFNSCVGFTLQIVRMPKKNSFGIRNIQYILALSVHKQPSVFYKTYTIQSRVNSLIIC